MINLIFGIFGYVLLNLVDKLWLMNYQFFFRDLRVNLILRQRFQIHQKQEEQSVVVVERS